MKNIKIFFYTLFSLLLMLAASTAMAVPIKIFAEPNTNSNEVGTVDLSQGIVPIFTSKDGQWLKIGDPSNGNVGWIESQALSDNPADTFIYRQKFIKSDDGKQTVQTIQFGNTSELKTMDNQSYKEMQTKQDEIRKSMEKNMQELMEDINRLYKRQMEVFQHDYPNFPLMPVIVIPTEKVPASIVKPASTIKKTKGEMKIEKISND